MEQKAKLSQMSAETASGCPLPSAPICPEGEIAKEPYEDCLAEATVQ